MPTDVSDVYAVIRSGGKQYRVSPGQRIKLERLDGDAGDQVTFDDVLLVNGEGELAIGSPIVESASVTGEILEQGRGRKITVFKYKNKTRYRRVRGHRQLQTSVLVNAVNLGDQSWTAPARVQPAAAAAIEATDETADEAADVPAASAETEDSEE